VTYLKPPRYKIRAISKKGYPAERLSENCRISPAACFLTTKHTKRYKNICVQDKKTVQAGNPAFFRTDGPRVQQKKAGFLFLSRTQQKRYKKVRECSVLIIFVCFVVKKADGLLTPCGKYTVGDSFLEITYFRVFRVFRG